MQYLIAFITIAASSIYVLFLDHLLLSPRSLQKILVIPIIIIGLAVYYAVKRSTKLLQTKYDKWLFLFGCTAFIQLLILASGGFQSPFLILIHLFMISISFFLSFTVAIIFLLSSFLVVLVDMSFYHGVIQTLINDPTTILLQVVSLIVIIPLAYLISQQYHAKDIVSRLLKLKVATNEFILNNVSDMVIVTNNDFAILSVNAAAEHILQQSRSELLDKPLFNVLLLKDGYGKLVTQETLFPDGKIPTNSKEKTFFLMKTNISQRAVNLSVQPVKVPDRKSKQITFIIRYNNMSKDDLAVTLDKARGKYEALLQSIKKKIHGQQLSETQTNLFLLEKIENDTYMVQLLNNYVPKATVPKIDIAQLCKQIVLNNQTFAHTFNVAEDFALHNFGMHDIEPLIVKNFPIKPEQLTGPFFTMACDVQQVEFAIKKLLDLSVFLASSEKKPKVILSVQRTTAHFIIKVTASCSKLTEKEERELLLPYYGNLSDKTNVHLGSGLEGYLVKKIAEQLGITLHISQQQKPVNQILFTLKLPK